MAALYACVHYPTGLGLYMVTTNPDLHTFVGESLHYAFKVIPAEQIVGRGPTWVEVAYGSKIWHVPMDEFRENGYPATWAMST